MNTPHPRPRKKTLMRNLGEFFGHIAHGVTSNPHAPQGQIPAANTPPSRPLQPQAAPPVGAIRQQTLEQQVETPEGKLILRRTIIDEVRKADERP